MSALTVELIRTYAPYLNVQRPKFKTKKEALEATSPASLGKIAIVDVETTDLSIAPVEITEFGVQIYLYNKETKEILSEGDSYNEMNEPTDLAKITPMITEITGITAEDVIGKAIDWDLVNVLLDEVDFIIAHNAGFDKPKVQPFLTSEKTWLCSFKGVDWKNKLNEDGFSTPNEKLEILCLHYGHWTYSGHRAVEDVRSTGHLINQMGILGEMIANGTKETAIVEGYLDAFNTDKNVSPIKDIVTGKNIAENEKFGYVFAMKSEVNPETKKKEYWYEVQNLTTDQIADLEVKLMNLMKKYNPKGIDKLEFYTRKQSY
jgi:DNA polymerase-3 subunit epsilon